MKAFPNQLEMIDHCTFRETMKGGMDLRDYFAAKAMQGFLSNAFLAKKDPMPRDTMASLSYKLADAMMEARK